MRIAITGASGFIGQALIERVLQNDDNEIVALSRSKYDGRECERICFRTTDYSVDSLKDVLKDADVVVHLAAVRGTQGRLQDYHINEIITENLLIAMGECNISRIVFASSIAVYSDTSRMPWTEDMMLTPKTLYGITKASCEALCMYYSRVYGFKYSIVRIAQVLGTGEKRRTMINVFMEQAASKEQLHVTGRSIAKRQFIYVKDVAGVLYKAASAVDGSVIINAGMDEACSNLDIAKLVNTAFYSDIPIDYNDSVMETIESSVMSTKQCRKLLGYECMSMEKALENIAANW